MAFDFNTFGTSVPSTASAPTGGSFNFDSFGSASPTATAIAPAAPRYNPLKEIGDAFVSSVKQVGQDINDMSNAPDLPTLLRGSLQTAIHVGYVPASAFAPASPAIQAAGNAISDTPLIKRASENPLSEQVFQSIIDATALLGTGALFAGGPKAARFTSETLDRVPAPTIAPKPTIPRANQIIGEQYRSTFNQYTRSANLLHEAETVHKTDPIAVLESYGKNVIPELENGKITAETSGRVVDFLDHQISVLSNLKNDAVFLNDNKVTIPEFSQFVLDSVEAQAARQRWSVEYTTKVKQQVQNTLDSYKAAHGPDGQLSISELDKIKTAETNQSKSYKNPGKDIFQYDSSGSIGKAARDLVEMYTEDAPTKELNKLIQSHYDAIDLVESLRGRTPHGGRFTTLLERTGGGIAGTLMGSSLGHPILGYVGGRVAADVFDNMLNSKFISNPLKRMIADNAEITDPAIKAQIQKYIDENSPNITDLGDQSYKSVPNNQLNTANPTVPINTVNTITPIFDILPSSAFKSISDHLTTAETIIKELPKAEFLKNGGLPQLLERTKINIADGLDAQGLKAVADQIRTFDLTPFKSWDAFKEALWSYIKNIQPGLSMKNIAPHEPNVVVQVVNAKTGAQTFYRIPKGKLADFHAAIDDGQGGIAGIPDTQGNIYHITSKAPEQMAARGFQDGGMAKLDDIPTLVPEHSRSNAPTVREHVRTSSSAKVQELMRGADNPDAIPQAMYEEYVQYPVRTIKVDDIMGLDHRGLILDAEKAGRQVTVPILVDELADGTFKLRDGNHRVTQALVNKDANIRAYVKPYSAEKGSATTATVTTGAAAIAGTAAIIAYIANTVGTDNLTSEAKRYKDAESFIAAFITRHNEDRELPKDDRQYLKEFYYKATGKTE